MQSQDAVNKMIGENVKQYTESMGRSSALMYKWIDGSTPNPVEDVIKMYESTGRLDAINYLCQKHDGYFVKNTHEMDQHESVNKIFSELGDMVTSIAEFDADGIWTLEEIMAFENLQTKFNSTATGFRHEMMKKVMDKKMIDKRVNYLA